MGVKPAGFVISHEVEGISLDRVIFDGLVWLEFKGGRDPR